MLEILLSFLLRVSGTAKASDMMYLSKRPTSFLCVLVKSSMRLVVRDTFGSCGVARFARKGQQEGNHISGTISCMGGV